MVRATDEVPTVVLDGEPLTQRAAATRDASVENSPAVVEALHVEETRRTRGWATAVAGMALASLAFTPALPGDARAKVPFVAALGICVLTAWWTRWRCADPRRYTPAVFRTFGIVLATISFELVYFLGVFSPVAVVIVLGITAIGLGLDRRAALAIPLYATTGYAVLALLVTTGAIRDAGVIHATGLTVVARMFAVVMVPVVLLTALGLARLSRQTMEQAARQCHAALRLADQRQALLREANQHLDDMLRPVGVQHGPWSGHRAGAWELGPIVGRGAMGEVYSARHHETSARAAIKLLHEEVGRQPTLLARFVREGEILRALDVPNIVRVYECGKLAERIPYIAMELLEGEDLATTLRRTGTLEPDAIVELARQVGAGLDAAHAAGIVHRDLKPQNLFRSGTGAWKILDFGVSTQIGSHGTLTEANIVGTPAYMAPEQARSQPLDARSDVFSLGAVLYRTFTGRQPFTGAGTPQILFDVVYSMPPRPRDVVPSVGADVEAVLALALAKSPDRRFPTAGALATALATAVRRDLPAPLRDKAAALLRDQPWNTTA